MKILKIKGALVLLTICITVKSSGLGFAFNQDTTRVHELLLYTVPSFIKLDWSSPSSLLEKSIDSFILSRFSKKSYSIGHMIIVFNTPMADSSVKMAMRSTSNKEKIDLFIRDEEIKLDMRVVRNILKNAGYLQVNFVTIAGEPFANRTLVSKKCFCSAFGNDDFINPF